MSAQFAPVARDEENVGIGETPKHKNPRVNTYDHRPPNKLGFQRDWKVTFHARLLIILVLRLL